MKIIIFFILFTLCNVLYSNVPGYLGKRISLDYDYTYTPVYYEYFPPYNWNRFSLGYVLSRTLHMTIDYEIQRFNDSDSKIQGDNFGFSLRHYNLNKSIAPVGRYFGTGVLYTSAERHNIYFVDQLKKIKYQGKQMKLVFTFTYGYKRVLFRFVTFDFGFQFGVAPLNFSEDEELINDLDEMLEEYFFRPYAGIGFLF